MTNLISFACGGVLFPWAKNLKMKDLPRHLSEMQPRYHQVGALIVAPSCRTLLRRIESIMIKNEGSEPFLSCVGMHDCHINYRGSQTKSRN